jgi:dTDP-4-amino-4,6-dideoxygalactose transaminase
MQRMLDVGISTRRGVMNAHLEGPYRNEADPVRLAVSEAAQQMGIILPLIPSMTAEQIASVCDHLVSAVAGTVSTVASA